MMKEFLKLSVLLIGPLKTIIARGCQRWSSNSISDALTWQFISVVTMSLNKLLLSSWCLSTMRPNIWTLKVYFFYFCSLFFVWVEIIISAADFRSKCLSATPNNHPHPHSPFSSSHPSKTTVTKSTNNSFSGRVLLWLINAWCLKHFSIFASLTGVFKINISRLRRPRTDGGFKNLFSFLLGTLRVARCVDLFWRRKISALANKTWKCNVE